MKTGSQTPPEHIEIVGIDPGFAALGYAVMGLRGSTAWVERAGVIRTKKSDRKRRVRASEDNVRRMHELAHRISEDVWSTRVVAMCTESQSWPRNASTHGKIGMAWGVVSTFAYHAQVPILQATPMELKRAVTGNGKASKEEVVSAMVGRYGDSWLPAQRTMHEHVADALGAVWACLDAPEIQMVRKMMMQ